jgi:acyl dehydratase
MSERRAIRIQNLRERIDRAQYHVDVDKVAEAVLGRPIAHMLIVPIATMSVQEPGADAAADDDFDPPPSQDVLKAA